MYAIRIESPHNENELFAAWCEELQLSAFGESENEAFYNLVENIPLFFDIKNETERKKIFSQKKPLQNRKRQTFFIPEFA